MYKIGNMTVLEGKDFSMDYCKEHAQYFKGPECPKCEERGIELMAEVEKAEKRPKLWL